jgi:methionyl-tRNA synthetase
MVEKYFEGKLETPKKSDFDAHSSELIALAKGTPDTYAKHMDNLEYSEALASVWKLINLANNYIEKEAPWKLSKEGKTEELNAVMYNLAQVLAISAILTYPVMPSTMENMWKQLGFTRSIIESAQSPEFGLKLAPKVSKGSPLFPRIEIK